MMVQLQPPLVDSRKGFSWSRRGDPHVELPEADRALLRRGSRGYLSFKCATKPREWVSGRYSSRVFISAMRTVFSCVGPLTSTCYGIN